MIIKLNNNDILHSERPDIEGKYVWLIRIENSNYIVYPIVDKKENYYISTAEYTEYIYGENHTEPEHYNQEKEYPAMLSDIDFTASNAANSIDKYLTYNEIVPADGQATIDDMKNFRTKVAEFLYSVYQLDSDSKLVEMLEYYKEGMTDKAVQLLSDFRNVQASLSPSGAFVDCGCATKPLTLTLGTVSVCDPLESYRKSVHDYMVLKFSDYTFWKYLNDEMPKDFDFIISMLEGIVKGNFPIVNLSGTFGYGDCSCLTYGTAQESAMKILNNLITTFEYIRDDEAEAHKNFVYSTLNSWANALYEVMSW